MVVVWYLYIRCIYNVYTERRAKKRDFGGLYIQCMDNVYTNNIFCIDVVYTLYYNEARRREGRIKWQ